MVLLCHLCGGSDVFERGGCVVRRIGVIFRVFSLLLVGSCFLQRMARAKRGCFQRTYRCYSDVPFFYLFIGSSFLEGMAQAKKGGVIKRIGLRLLRSFRWSKYAGFLFSFSILYPSIFV